MSAVRFAVFAERATVILADAKAIQNQSFSRDPDVRMEQARAKLAAKEDVALFEPILYPPDEPVN